MTVGRRRMLTVLLGSASVGGLLAAYLARPSAAALPEITVWKSASCGCCRGWATHMIGAGFPVKIVEMDDVTAIKTRLGVPEALQSCHTALVDGYVLEGHVPAADAIRLLRERPAGKGLAVPGMPGSAPGMDAGADRYNVVMFGVAGRGTAIYARH